MARILYFSNLDRNTDLIAIEQSKELARQLVHTGHSITLVSATQQSQLNRHWQELSQSGCLWIQPSKRWALTDTVLKTPSFLNSPADLLHFFINPMEPQFISSFLWISQILGQWRNSLTAISLTAPLKLQIPPLLKNFLAQADLIFSWDKESLRIASAMKESPQQQLLFEAPIFYTTSSKQLITDESNRRWSFLPRPFFYAPGLWQERGNLQNLARFLKELSERSRQLIVAGWNWREQREGALRELFGPQYQNQFFFPSQVHFESHLELSRLCSGFILRQINPQSLIYKESRSTAFANHKQVIDSIEDLNKSGNPMVSSAEDQFPSESPIHFFNRAYAEALAQF